jgi:hypothetical protein
MDKSRGWSNANLSTVEAKKAVLRRILLLVTVAAMMTVAGPAFATVHEIANSECSAGAASKTAAGTQETPGLTLWEGPDKSEHLGTLVVAVLLTKTCVC